MRIVELHPALLALTLWVAFCACGLAQSPTKPAGGQTATEMLNAGQTAFNTSQWKDAAELFAKFITDYGSVAEMVEAVRRVRPLIALCHVRLQDYPTALPLLDEALKDTRLDSALRNTLLFSQGVALLKTAQFEPARKAFGLVFSNEKADGAQRADALVLGGMTYLMEGKWNEAIDFFKKYLETMRQANPEAAARAQVLNLNALMQAARWEEALTAARQLHERRAELRQLITFQSLLLLIGEHFLEAKDVTKAVAALTLLERRDNLLSRQRERLNDFRSELDALEGNPNGFIRAAQLRGTVTDIEGELDAMEKMPEFDAAVRLRLAAAFQTVERYRESALILDQMVRQMEPSATLESASGSLIRLWMLQERWSRAIKSADLYLERFATFKEKPNLPEVLFCRAQAQQGLGKFAEAAEGFASMARQFPKHELAGRALFFEAYNYLNQERNAEALRRFDSLMQKIPTGEVGEDAAFWKAMTLYFDQKWEPCRDSLQSYLDQAKKGSFAGLYVAEAKFRRAYACFSEGRYDDAITEFSAFLKEHPKSEFATEARISLADSFAGVGRTDEAMKNYQLISTERMAFFEDAWFKMGKILQLTERFTDMRSHYETFLREHPKSQRVTAALHWIGWCWKKEGKTDQARDTYWDAIREHGNDPKQISLEEITTALAAFYPGTKKGELELELERERQSATDAGKKTLAARLRWAQAQLVKKGDPEKAKALLLQVAAEVNVETDNPRITIDAANAAFQAGDMKLAESLFDGIRKWHPRSFQRDQAWAGLGFIALQRKDKTRALDCFDKFERLTVFPKSAPDASGIVLVEGEVGGKVMMARARILADAGQLDKAQPLWKAAQKAKSYPPRMRAEAFFELAEALAKKGDHRSAVPYYEQIYVLYNRYPDLVASAYLARGTSLEKLGEKEKAREVYSELAQRKDLAAEPPLEEGRKRAETLGGVIPKVEAPEDSTKPFKPATEALKKDV